MNFVTDQLSRREAKPYRMRIAIFGTDLRGLVTKRHKKHNRHKNKNHEKTPNEPGLDLFVPLVPLVVQSYGLTPAMFSRMRYRPERAQR